MAHTGARPSVPAAGRKHQLAEAAAELFRRHGYHAVSVHDIAAAAGVTGPAVYRHFRGKQDILAHVLLSGLELFGEVCDEALAEPARTPAEALDRLARAVAELAVERREVTALWRWQGAHLDQAGRTMIRKQGNAIMAQWARALTHARDDLSAADAELLSWAALSVFGSVSVHHVSLPSKRRFELLLAGLARAVFDHKIAAVAVTPAGPPAADVAWRRSAVPASRREELLSAATALFREHGYHAVSMEEIGAKAGMAGPSVYRHFAAKVDILVAAGYRMADRLRSAARFAIDEAADPAGALHAVAKSYVDIVLRSDDLLGVFASELAKLPDREHKELVRLQRSYVAEWVRLLRAVAGTLSEPEARIAVHAALTVINDLTRTPRIAHRPAIRDELADLAVTVLGGV